MASLTKPSSARLQLPASAAQTSPQALEPAAMHENAQATPAPALLSSERCACPVLAGGRCGAQPFICLSIPVFTLYLDQEGCKGQGHVASCPSAASSLCGAAGDRTQMWFHTQGTLAGRCAAASARTVRTTHHMPACLTAAWLPATLAGSNPRSKRLKLCSSTPIALAAQVRTGNTRWRQCSPGQAPSRRQHDFCPPALACTLMPCLPTPMLLFACIHAG